MKTLLFLCLAMKITGYTAAAAEQATLPEGASFVTTFSLYVSDTPTNPYSTRTFEWANVRIAAALETNALNIKLHCFVVPAPGGYLVLILSPRRLSDYERTIIRKLAESRIEEAAKFDRNESLSKRS